MNAASQKKGQTREQAKRTGRCARKYQCGEDRDSTKRKRTKKPGTRQRKRTAVVTKRTRRKTHEAAISLWRNKERAIERTRQRTQTRRVGREAGKTVPRVRRTKTRQTIAGLQIWKRERESQIKDQRETEQVDHELDTSASSSEAASSSRAAEGLSLIHI